MDSKKMILSRWRVNVGVSCSAVIKTGIVIKAVIVLRLEVFVRVITLRLVISVRNIMATVGRIILVIRRLALCHLN